MASYPIVDVHPSGFASAAPIPVRERQISAASGHAVRLSDWAVLAEMLAERGDVYQAGHADAIDAYPDCFQWRVYGPEYSRLTHFGMINALTPSSAVDAGGVLRSSAFVDSEWDFAPEYYDGNYGLFTAHGQPLVQTVMRTGRRRLLDDLRRRFYDVRRCTRRTVPARALSLDENWVAAYGFNNSDAEVREYHEQGGSVGALSVDLSSFIPSEVLGHSNFAATPRRILARYWIHDDDRAIDKRRTVWLPIGARGAIDTNGIGWRACRDVYNAEIGTGPAGNGESYVNAELFAANGYVVIYDFKYPYDGLLASWSWEPN